MITVELRNRAGKAVATIEVPETPSHPLIVKWGASYYLEAEHTARVYEEVWCYAVPTGGTVQT